MSKTIKIEMLKGEHRGDQCYHCPLDRDRCQLNTVFQDATVLPNPDCPNPGVLFLINGELLTREALMTVLEKVARTARRGKGDAADALRAHLGVE